MTRDEAKFFLTEWAAAAASLAGGALMVVANFDGSLAAWGLTLLVAGGAGFSVTYWLRRQCKIRFRRRFRR